jgi:hypothetical protein
LNTVFALMTPQNEGAIANVLADLGVGPGERGRLTDDDLSARSGREDRERQAENGGGQGAREGLHL